VKRPAESGLSEMDAEADKLIEEMERNWSPETLAKAEEFEKRSPEHERCLERNVLRRNSLPPDWLDRSTETTQPSARERAERVIPTRWRWAGVVAAALVAISIAVWIAVAGLRVEDRHPSPAVERVALTRAAQIALTDGSDLLLYAGTRATERMEEDRREITLTEGGLSVRVAKDARRPFSVVTSNAEVVAEGTQFNLLRRSGGTDVCVREGVVRISSRAGSMRLSSGDSITVADGGEFIPVHPAGGSSSSPVVHFNRMPLLEIAAALNNVNCSVQFEVAPDVAGRVVSAYLDLSRPEIWKVILERDPALRVEPRMGLIRVMRR
jgi:ferric-dicitrate binding protein FerR (iron transport regulator)